MSEALIHEHRPPAPVDFVGKTITRFDGECDNIWRFWFADGTAFAIQCEASSDGIAYMELCDECVSKESME